MTSSLLQGLDAAAPFGLIVIDPCQRIRHANAYMRRHLPASPEAWLERPIQTLLPVAPGTSLPCLQGQCHDCLTQPHRASRAMGELRLQLRAESEPDVTDALHSLICFPVAATEGAEPWHALLFYRPHQHDLFHRSLGQALQQLQETRDEHERLGEQMARANEHLMQSGKLAAIGQLAAGVAHEINNPIGYVYSNLQSLASYVRDLLKIVDAIDQAESVNTLRQLKQALEYDAIRQDVAELISESGEGIDRVKQIITALKDFSHVETGSFQATDLHRCLDSTLNLANNEIKYRADVTRDYDPELPLVECDASQIKQVMLNLIINAAQAITERGQITVRTGHHDGMAWFDIEDTGSGMSPDILEHVFDPFFTTKPVGQGTGLGLSVSFSIVRKHLGRIEIRSTPAVGTCFRVLLPVHHGKEP